MQTITTPQQNVDLTLSLYQAFGRGDIDFILGHLTEDVTWVSHAETVVPWSGNYSGRENVRRFFTAIYDSVETLKFEPQESISQNDLVVWIGTYACRVNATGKSGEQRWVFVWRITDGQISSYEQFIDPEFAQLFRV